MSLFSTSGCWRILHICALKVVGLENMKGAEPREQWRHVCSPVLPTPAAVTTISENLAVAEEVMHMILPPGHSSAYIHKKLDSSDSEALYPISPANRATITLALHLHICSSAAYDTECYRGARRKITALNTTEAPTGKLEHWIPWKHLQDPASSCLLLPPPTSSYLLLPLPS